MPTRGRLIPALFILILTAAALYVIWPASPRGVVLSVDVLQQGLLVKVPVEFLQVRP